MICAALESDTPTIHSLFLEAGDNAGKTSWYRYLYYRRRTEQWDKIVIDGEIRGFVHWAMKMDNTRVIYDLVVLRSHRHQGCGRALLRHVGTPVTTKLTHGFLTHMGFVAGYLFKEPPTTPTGPWIMTYTGKMVNPLDLQPEDICIADIAHHLACVNRFAGAVAKPISVAQHSVYVSRLCDQESTDHYCVPSTCVVCEARQKICLQGLLHDAAEAYLGDVTKWLKAELPNYIVAEERAQRMILSLFGCEENLHPLVERGDRVMVMFEASKGFGQAWTGRHLNTRPGYEPITDLESALIGKWAPWNWRAAEEAFLVRYRRCTGK